VGGRSVLASQSIQRTRVLGRVILIMLCLIAALAAAPTIRAAEVRGLELPPTAGAPDFTNGSVQFVGTATVILRYAGFTVLTDPNFLHKGDHVHLGYGLTSQRLTDPAVTLEQLPPIDLVVLSHFHGDHFDQLVQKKLDRNLPIITTPSAARQLASLGFKATRGLATWESMTVSKGSATLKITAMPGRHGPPGINIALPEVMGSVLDFGPSGSPTPTYRMYITGDTLVYDDLKQIPKRYPDIDLALLHLGGTRVMGILVTMDAKQGIEALRIVDPHLAIPIHYDDYDVFKSPLADFQKAVREAGLEAKVKYLAHGEVYRFHGRDRAQP
jgi:L-ascorbate metabolism protein UlaG (beta-lactamase superfamily)